MALEQNVDVSPPASAALMFPEQLPCKWPVYNQQNNYQCVQMSHAGNDEILYIIKYYK